jgi:lipopolysaccharide assembly protein A
MQAIRTVAWVVLLVALLTFAFFNWKPVEVQIWDNLILETKVPALVIISFLLGLVPMWLLHRGAKWRYSRRISALETAARANAANAAAAAAQEQETASIEEPAEPFEQPPKPRDEILG